MVENESPDSVRSTSGVSRTSRRRERQPFVASAEHQCGGEVPARRLPADDDPVRGLDLEQRPVSREAVVDRRRVRVVGGHAVVDGPGAQLHVRRHLATHRTAGVSAPDVERAAVHVEEDRRIGAVGRALRRDDEHRYAAACGRLDGQGHVGGGRVEHRRESFVGHGDERAPRVDVVGLGRIGLGAAHAETRREELLRLGAHRRRDRDPAHDFDGFGHAGSVARVLLAARAALRSRLRA